MTELENSPPRPRPILDAIRTGAWVPAVGAVVTAAVAFGVLNADQGRAVEAVLAALVGLFTAGTAALNVFHVLRRAEPEVTPVADPQDDLGRRLIPER